jgi:hypothetical protein
MKIAINLWKEYISYIVQEYKNDLNKMELDISESEQIVTLDQVRKIFDEANRDTCYHITEVDYFYFFFFKFMLSQSNLFII